VRTIHLLPADLANQIAAGEVVERPASVVKELLENAIDAGARRIAVTIEFGGKALIRVEDDGGGMAPEDATLALERHATSKIRSADDLGRIATLGFRGEALPSIASVSRFTLRSRARGAPSGVEIRVDGGTPAGEREAGMPEGTSVEVADLFFNLPARRKFLKSDAAEATQISRLVTQMALCYPELGMTLTSAGRRLLQCPPVESLRDRLYQIHGDRPDLVEVRREAGGVIVTGYVAALAEQGPVRGPQHLFVNRRVVKDRTMAHAIIEAYRMASMRERSPEVHLFLEMPPDAVDVNVHPTKAEVRFRDQAFVHQIVRRALGDALGRGPAPELTLQAPAGASPSPATLPLPAGFAGVLPGRWTRPGPLPQGWETALPRTGSVDPDTGASGRDAGQGSADADVRVVAPGAADERSPTVLRPMMPLGQFRDTFIIAVDEEGIAIVDQHVAHERILFERIMERLTSGRLESQRLLTPMLVDLPPAGRQALLARAGDLDRLGFEVEEFGGGAVRVSACPALLRRDECDAAIRALADDLEQLDRGAPVEEALRRIAATMACHAAVKANDRLTPEKMVHILDELRRTAFSTVCPHGRPVMLRLTRREVEKNFQRI
jgi:DNA mismatch repair protein MutL